ncbi:MAG TPA: hypothetical protein VE973_01115, partial [Candidatus Limnocylindria bacterium]|nr:hypothetical protein [Candidatus Limnocylindria bacterium]
MVLPLHIIIALLSLASSGYILFRPSRLGLNLSYALVALTLISGFVLVMTKPANITQTCVTGLVYLGFVAFGIVS